MTRADRECVRTHSLCLQAGNLCYCSATTSSGDAADVDVPERDTAKANISGYRATALDAGVQKGSGKALHPPYEMLREGCILFLEALSIQDLNSEP